VDSTEFDIVIDPGAYPVINSPINVSDIRNFITGFKTDDRSSVDATMFLFGIDGTYDVIKYVENS